MLTAHPPLPQSLGQRGRDQPVGPRADQSHPDDCAASLPHSCSGRLRSRTPGCRPAGPRVDAVHGGPRDVVEHDLGGAGQAWAGSDDAQYVCFCKGKATEEKKCWRLPQHVFTHDAMPQCHACNSISTFVHSLAPEHGPPNYQQTVPYTRQPLASIWEINHWIALRQQVSEGKWVSWKC
jgi:hypothetical protein